MLDEYLHALKTLSKDCNFKNMTASQYCEESIRDAFIAGLQWNPIRWRLLENKTLELKTMFDQGLSLESTAKSSESYTALDTLVSAAAPSAPLPLDDEQGTSMLAVVSKSDSPVVISDLW